MGILDGDIPDLPEVDYEKYLYNWKFLTVVGVIILGIFVLLLRGCGV